MGIQGLLPLMKSVMVPIHIKDLEGCSVDVDTYSWLHKGALSCSMELCKSQPTSKFDQFINSHGDIKTTTNNIYGSYKKGSFGSQTIDLVISSISRDASTKNRSQDNISQKTNK